MAAAVQPQPSVSTSNREASSLPINETEPPASDGQAEIVPAQAEQTPSLSLPENYKHIPIPDAPSLSQSLQLARALKPLARQIAVGLPTAIDEAATVDQIAKTGVWQPVLKPKSELWLDIALVFDQGPSMCLWQRLKTDLQRLLSRYGEFRDVRTWLIRHSSGQIEFTSRNGRSHKPTELLIGDRRRLVVIVSDCVAPAWHNGQMRELIATWSAKLPTVVFQVFPERLWARTALSRSVMVELQAKRPVLASNSLHPTVRSVWDQERLDTCLAQEERIRLPVVPLEQEALANWAQLVTGDRHSRVLGIVWDAQPVFPPASVQAPETVPSSSSIQEQIDRFMLTAAPTSRDLARLLVAAPVITLPIARLIKQSMLPRASAVNMAEVFMSGLLRVSGNQVSTFDNAESVAYELVDDQVRERLQARAEDTLTVFDKVSQHVAARLGRSVSEFLALLRTPAVGQGSDETQFLDAFATVTGKILRGLGGEFEAIADALVPSSIPPEGGLETEYELEPFKFFEAQLTDDTEPSFPPLETEEFTVISFETEETIPALAPFEFSVARLVKEQRSGLGRFLGWGGRQSGWVIQRQKQQAYRYIETLPNDVPLEMVAIPAGTFLMGSPEDEPERFAEESPQHEVAVAAFSIGRYPITQAQWKVVAALPQVERDLDPDPSNFKGDNRPVEQVSWLDATEFCARLSAYTGREYRLPSEAEWEYACRAGTTTPFHFGETISSELACYQGGTTYADGPEGENRGGTTPVDHFGVANAFGLSDMHGNVWEWCQDHWHSNYEGAPTNGSAWLSSDEGENDRVSRGGSWYVDPRGCRSACRDWLARGDLYDALGFRVCCASPRTL